MYIYCCNHFNIQFDTSILCMYSSIHIGFYVFMLCSSIHVDFYVPGTYNIYMYFSVYMHMHVHMYLDIGMHVSLGACRGAPGCKLIIPSMEEVCILNNRGVAPVPGCQWQIYRSSEGPQPNYMCDRV